MNNARYCRKCGCYLPDNKYICLACGFDNYKKASQVNTNSANCSNCIYAMNVRTVCYSEFDSEVEVSIYCKRRSVTFLNMDGFCCKYYQYDPNKRY